MLSLIIGPAGSGKTAVLQRRAAQAAAQGRDVLLLVPGQFVFSSERQLLSLDGGPQVRVLSFERMAHLFGAEGSKVADAAAKQALMSVALQHAAPHLGAKGAGALFLADIENDIVNIRFDHVIRHVQLAAECVAKANANVLCRMMIINFCVSITLNIQIKSAMFCKQSKHVIKKTTARLNIGYSSSIQVQ